MRMVPNSSSSATSSRTSGTGATASRRQPGRLPEIGLHALQIRRDLSPEGALQLLALQGGERFADAVFDLDEILAASLVPGLELQVARHDVIRAGLDARQPLDGGAHRALAGGDW